MDERFWDRALVAAVLTLADSNAGETDTEDTWEAWMRGLHGAETVARREWEAIGYDSEPTPYRG